jgi:hypothetical protein
MREALQGLIEIRNALITEATIYADNSYTGVNVKFSYGDAFHTTGNLKLTEPLIRQIMIVAGVKEWSAVVGKPIVVRLDKPSGKVSALRHFLDDVWCSL